MPKRRKTTFQNQLFSHRPNLFTLPSIRTSCCFNQTVGHKAQVGERHTSAIPIPFHTIPYPISHHSISHASLITIPLCHHRYAVMSSSLCYPAIIAMLSCRRRYFIALPSLCHPTAVSYAVIPSSLCHPTAVLYEIPPPLLSHSTAIPMPSCRHNNAMTIFSKPYPPPIL